MYVDKKKKKKIVSYLRLQRSSKARFMCDLMNETELKKM